MKYVILTVLAVALAACNATVPSIQKNLRQNAIEREQAGETYDMVRPLDQP